MRRTVTTLAAATLVLTLAVNAQAQPPQPPQPGERPTFVPPVIAALDKNGDGVIDADEIAGAVEALKSLDSNGDGKLTREDLLGARRGFGQRPEARGNFVEGLLEQYDTNKDGKIRIADLPERMQAGFRRADTNEDGILDKAELEALGERFGRFGGGRPGAGGRPGGDGARPGRPGRPGGEGRPGRPGGDGGRPQRPEGARPPIID